MSKSRASLKKRLLNLLREDEEFRLAVAGLLGLEELLKRAEEQEKRLEELREEMLRGFQRLNEALARLTEFSARHEVLLARLAESSARHEERLAKLEELTAKLAESSARHEELLARLMESSARHEERLAKLEELTARHEELLARHEVLLARLAESSARHEERLAKLEELTAKLAESSARHEEEIAKVWREMERLREDFNRGFTSLSRRLDALGARWGLMAESAFREGLKGLLEDLGLTVEKWRTYDSEGRVFGFASEVEIDVAVKDGQTILVEIASHVKASDVAAFKRKAELYFEITGRVPARLIMITPYIDEAALKAAERLGVEVYTSV